MTETVRTVLTRVAAQYSNLSRDDREDAVSEAIIRALRGYDETKSASFQTSAVRYLHWVCKNMITRRRRDSGVDPDELPARESPDEADVLDVREALSRLAEPHRLLLHDIYFRGLTQAEIAEGLGVDPSQVCRMVTEAKEAFRAAYESGESP